MEVVFGSDLKLNEVASSVARTGLLMPASVWGGLVYVPGPSLIELGHLASLQTD